MSPGIFFQHPDRLLCLAAGRGLGHFPPRHQRQFFHRQQERQLDPYAPLLGVTVTATGDQLFPAIVAGHRPPPLQIVFLAARVSALFPSADGAITALTSTFCIDLLVFAGLWAISRPEKRAALAVAA